ncbi:hypothetical protein ACQ4PT_002109 [Festuca glaucescens]
MSSSTSAKLVWSPLLALLLLSVCDASSSAEDTDGSPEGTSVVFSIDNYGARGDGKHDDTQALAKAWNGACSSSRPAVLIIPNGKSYLLKSTIISGPCNSTVVFMVKGTLVAPPTRSDWTENNIRHWIMFQGISDLTVTGGGAINEDCTNVQLTRLSITAPGTSPNTDGIHITRSKDVQVRDCVIKTGDDCMSIEDGTHNLHVTKVVCGPGHGISIGSLGDDNSRAEVFGITIDSVQLYGTTNGARIKTWQGGSGFAKDITFQNIIMDNVQNPIIIDQNYCDSSKPCKDQESAVEISNIVFKNIRGTTPSKDAIKLSCNKNAPCSDIFLENIELKLEGGKGNTESTCQNAKWRKSGNVVPSPCKGNN